MEWNEMWQDLICKVYRGPVAQYVSVFSWNWKFRDVVHERLS